MRYLPVVLAFSATLIGTQTLAAQVTVDLMGSWYSKTTEQNFRLRTTVLTESLDQEPLTGLVGRYKIDSLALELSTLGNFSTPFTLQANPDSSLAYVYPSSRTGAVGEVRFVGDFANGQNLFPNGIQALAYDFRIYFADISDDRLSSLLGPMNHTFASAYVTDQIGARAGNLENSSVLINSVPEPSSFALLFLGLSMLSYRELRSKGGGGTPSDFRS